MAYGAILEQRPPTPTATNVTVQASTASEFGISGESNVDAVLQAAATMIGEGAQIATGSYVGTGTYGASNPNSLTFDFSPKIICVFESGIYASLSSLLISTYGNEGYAIVGESSSSGSTSFTWNGNTVSWYATASADRQFNSKITYRYFAIG